MRKLLLLLAAVGTVFTACEAVDGLDKEIGDIKIPSNTIHYTSTDGNVVTPSHIISFSVNIVSNTYEDGKGIITFDGDITLIEQYAFSNCSSLATITIPDSVTSIGHYAFRSCSNLTSVTIPDSVTEIGVGAFSDCRSLTAFYGKFASADNRYLIIDGVINSFAQSGLTSYIIPDSVTAIGNSAFYGCSNLTSVTITDSVTSIGAYAFSNCSGLTNITIPDSVTEIADYAFQMCSNLTSITIPDSVTVIGDGTFYGCESLSAFYGKLASDDNRYLIIDGVLKSFAPSGLTSYIIPDSVTAIGNSAFYGCSSLTTITIPKSITAIGKFAFEDCSNLTSVNITDLSAWCRIKFNIKVSDTSDYYFSGTNPLQYAGKLYLNGIVVVDLTLPLDITQVYDGAFFGCTSLTSVTIPESVTSIGFNAFANCSGLTTIYCKPTTPPTGDAYMFYSNASGRKIYVPTASVSAYKAAEYWSDYSSYIVGYDF